MSVQKVLEINSVPYGSTCRIMLGIAQVGREQGLQVDTASGYSYHPVSDLPPQHIRIGGPVGKTLHMLLGQMTGYHGCFSHWATLRLILHMEKTHYDIVHLHNLHGWYLNLPMLFGYLKKRRIRTVWTLHDCWALTGQCPYFTMVGCDKWRTGCHDCPQLGIYPESRVDRTKTMWRLKKKWFTDVPDLTIVTPSQWLADLVKQSYLKEYPVRVIRNGIDLDVFKPTPSDFRERCGIGGGYREYMILGVADSWSVYKGLDVFVELAGRLDERFQIVLVGTNEKIDKNLPENIISVHRTQDQKELAQLYTAADVFVNPTREDNYPTVNMEALACGTPVITFATNGSPESIDETCGAVVETDDTDALQREIERVCTGRPYSAAACMRRAERFDKGENNMRYLDLYKEERA